MFCSFPLLASRTRISASRCGSSRATNSFSAGTVKPRSLCVFSARSSRVGAETCYHLRRHWPCTSVLRWLKMLAAPVIFADS